MNFEYYLSIFFEKYLVPTLDITFMTLIIFYIYIFIQKTKAGNLAKGLLLVFIFLFILDFFKFPIFSWLFERIISYLLIILILIFSPEIRSLLIMLGKKSGLKKLTKEELESLNIIVNSSEKLSLKKIGALIVIERKENILPLLTSYLPIDSTLSEEIFFFIFDKKSLIHDGAAIIKGKRIMYVSAILPLSEKELPEKHMGTRHRAGLGITEESDAISIIISEESGRISLCENGIMHINLTKVELKRLLKNLLFVEEEPKKNE